MPYNPVILVGLGGIGSHLAEPLARYIATQPDPSNLVLIDGDSYKRSNQSRQRATERELGHNKASTHAARLQELFPALRITASETFLDERNVRSHVVEDACVFACVDNHASRKLLNDAVLSLRNGALLSAGNDLEDGNAQVFLRQRGKNVTPPLDKYHEEIRYPQDVNPAHLSCDQLARQASSAQVLMANFTAAALLLNAYYAIKRGHHLEYAEVYFDIVKNAASPRPRL